MPRPAKAPSDKKAITIKVRVTEEQQRRMKAAADNAGIELSTWIRLVALEQADSRRRRE